MAFPTETVYGLGARAVDGDAVRAVFAAKGRPADNPLIVHVDGAPAPGIAAWNDLAGRLAEAFWPGPLTLVLPRGSDVADVVTAGRETVAVRMPDHPVARALIAGAGPLAAPSANRSGRPSPTLADHVLTDLAGRVAWIVDGGACREGLESTVLDLTGAVPMLLRPGTILREQIEAVIGAVGVHPSVDRPSETADARAPGMRYQHYRPDATVHLMLGEAAVARARRWAGGRPAARLLLVTDGAAGPGERVFPDIGALGRALYRELRAADDDSLADVVVAGVDASPALMNRLRKAATVVDGS